MTTGGFPHSDISGSQPVYDSPELFAVHHVLHRRNAPRHPPSALLFLDSVCTCISSSSSVCDGRVSSTNPSHPHSSISNHQVVLSVKEPRFLVCRHALVARPPHGDERDRTADPLLARQVLSQLSYAPDSTLMGLPGLEPGTSRLSGVRSKPAEL
jgi:hypothetical protein